MRQDVAEEEEEIHEEPTQENLDRTEETGHYIHYLYVNCKITDKINMILLSKHYHVFV